MVASSLTLAPTGAFMAFTVDLFWSFRSRYSYLAIPKTQKLVAEYDVTVNLRPVYPLAMRIPGFFRWSLLRRPTSD